MRFTSSRIVRDERGSMTIFGMFLFVAVAIVGGLALDMSSAIHTIRQLQIAADTAAHAAIVSRHSRSETDAKLAALDLARFNMPRSLNGDVLKAEDIEFGVWDAATETFTPRPGSASAVRVSTRRATANANSLPTFLLKFVGFMSWQLDRSAIYIRYTPGCFVEGFVARDLIDIQSNNEFEEGFCLHSSGQIEVNQNNRFHDGTRVITPTDADLILPASGMDRNPGLREAAEAGGLPLRVLNDIPGMIAELSDPNSPARPLYITSANTVPLGEKDLTSDMLQPGAVHIMSCRTNGRQVNVKSGTLFDQVILVTNCSLKFEKDVALEDAIIATTSTDRDSLNSPSGLRVGRADGCNPGGSGRLVTLGGVRLAAKAELHGSQIIAAGDVNFSANANGVQGGSIISGGTISGTSNMTMGVCGRGMEVVEQPYFRPVL